MAQPKSTNAQLVLAAVDRYNRAHPGKPIDPQAELAISEHEGLSGGVGDNGTSFGPNQLHQGGAYPSFAPQAEQAAQGWAWSPQGLDYTMEHVGSVAGGLHGLPAIEAISTRFERPANPAAEIADAAHHYGIAAPNVAGFESGMGMPGAAGGTPTTSAGANPQQSQESQAAKMLAAAVGNANATVGLPNPAGIGNLLARAAAGARR